LYFHPLLHVIGEEAHGLFEVRLLLSRASVERLLQGANQETKINQRRSLVPQAHMDTPKVAEGVTSAALQTQRCEKSPFVDFFW